MKRLGLIALVLAAVLVTAQERPQTVNAKVVDRPVSGTLSATIQGVAASDETAWVGYAVPVVAGEQHMCCFNNAGELRGRNGCCGGCKLEKQGGENFSTGSVEGCSPGGDEFFVLARVSGGQVEKIRSYSDDCALDLSGQTLYWLGDPKPAESLAWLSGFAARYSRGDRLADGALSAIAFHKDPAADAALQRFLAPNQDRKLREQAAFWLGNTRGQRGFELVRDAIRNDADAKFREQATFALSQSDVPAAQPELVRVAHQDPDAEVRGQALFWLAQKAGKKAESVITDAIENDPETAVKKKAVFALSQMDANEGVPLLIQVAKSNRNPIVRKEAIFWLGQSNDPRALDYIESILKQ
jgi:hypothetical protein